MTESDKMSKEKNPFLIYCKGCGATVGYDIMTGNYKCAFCGEPLASEEAEYKWRRLLASDRRNIAFEAQVAECVSCGAKIIYENDEASEKCDFCGGNLIRRAFSEADSFPDLIIPFVITPDEAKQRLKEWANKLKTEREKNIILSNIDKLTGFYLPYRMIRGPVAGTAERDQMGKTYTFAGYVDCTFVNSSNELDNELLEEIEPFDISQIKEFNYGYIGGIRVKLNTLSDALIKKRVLSETAKAYKPYIDEVLQTDDSLVLVREGNFLNIPTLLPVYIYRSKKFCAVMNGQTGKIAITSTKKPKESKKWLIEPTLLTLAATLAVGYFFKFWIPAMVMFGGISALVFYTAYGQDRNRVIQKQFYKSGDTKAKRENKKLVIEESTFKNPLSNKPVFYERTSEGDIPVKVRFYTPMRILSLILQVVLMVLLPLLIALPISLLTGNLNISYGGAWYMLMGGVAVIYFIRGIRWDVYNHPILYEIKPDLTLKLFGTRASRRVSIFSMLGFGRGIKFSDLGGIGIVAVIFIGIMLLGSVAAIVL